MAYIQRADEGLREIALFAGAGAGCADCAHFRKPGKSNGYCCGRDDLPLAYGTHHPLRKLPADGGENCAAYTLKPALKGTGF